MKEIQQVEEKFGILDRIPVGACVLRDDFIVLFWNSCLEDWTKIPKSEIVGQNLAQRFPHLSQPKYLRRLKQVFQGGPPTIFSSQLHKHLIPAPLPDGEFRIQHTTVTPVECLQGEGFYALLAIEDVTDLTRRIQDYRSMRDRALEEIEERKQAQEALHQKTIELEVRQRQLILLSEMSDLLQACLTVKEAYNAIAQCCKLLFPQVSGAVFTIASPNNLLDMVATWGIALTTHNVFAPHECWALRRGRIHFVSDLHKGLVCQHLQDKLLPAEYCCVPMMAQGQALGVLYLCATHKGQLTESTKVLAMTVAEHIALALANLKLRETLHNQSIRDPLTGLYNRRYLEEALDREVERAQLKGHPLSLMMIDVDHFKQFNDDFGHEAGDEVLRQLGQFFLKNIRETDIACRYGGEEFTLILPEAPLPVTQERAQHLRQKVKGLMMEFEGLQLPAIALSLGVAGFPEHGHTSSALMRAADVALYQAKADGRDRVIVAS